MRISLGASTAPKASAAMQKIANLATNQPTSPKLAEPVVATPAKTVSRITAAKSSTNRMPTMVWPQPERRLPPSRNPFSRMAELLMAMAPPRYRLLAPVIPIQWLAISIPRKVMAEISITPITSTRKPIS